MPKKDDTVFYSTGRNKVRARVKTAHRDGSLSIVAMFFQNEVGGDMGGYLGMTIRMDPRVTRMVDAAGKAVA